MRSVTRPRGDLLPLLLTLPLILGGPGAAAGADRTTSVAAALAAPHAADRVIVGLERGMRPATVLNRTAGLVQAATPLSPSADGAFVIELAADRSVADALRRLRDRPGVAYVEPDYRVWPAAESDDPSYLDGTLWGMYGDDSAPHRNEFGSGAAEAWRDGFVGDGRIHVGVMDEGLKVDHPDLADNVWTNAFETVNGLDDDGNGYVDDIHGWDFHSDDASIYDGGADDHGTHVAGTIGARGGNGRGVAGVSWDVTLVPAKFLGVAGGYISDAVRALDYLTDLRTRHGLQLVATNNSWTGGGYSQALADAITRGGDAGILFVAAAGNDGTDVDQEAVYPGAYRCDTTASGEPRGWDCVISAAGIEAEGALASGSNRGSVSVDLGAPADSILSTHPQDDGYARYSGTSMAAAHVSGGLALCASADRGRSSRDLRRVLLDTTTPTTSLSGRTVTGGRLDVGRLIEHCAPDLTPQPVPDPTPVPVKVQVDELDTSFKRKGKGWTRVHHGTRGHHYRLPVRGDERESHGAWRPVLAAPGTYRVAAYIPIAPDASHGAVYKIMTADGWVVAVRNQHKRQGRWMSLGIHELTTTPSVRLADLTRDQASLDRYLVYDAVRFVPYP